MPIGTAVHERTFPLCESLNYREWSGYYAVSAYEAHHEHEYNAIRNAAARHRHLAALQVPHLGQGRDAPRRPDRHAGPAQGQARLGHLHALVRRARQGHRRRHRLAAVRERLPLDRGRSEPALVPAERPRPRRDARGRLRRDRGPRGAGPDLGPHAQGDRRGRHREPQVLQGHLRQDRRRARSTSPAPATRETSATRSGFPGRTPSRSGTS